MADNYGNDDSSATVSGILIGGVVGAMAGFRSLEKTGFTVAEYYKRGVNDIKQSTITSTAPEKPMEFREGWKPETVAKITNAFGNLTAEQKRAILKEVIGVLPTHEKAEVLRDIDLGSQSAGALIDAVTKHKGEIGLRTVASYMTDTRRMEGLGQIIKAQTGKRIDAFLPVDQDKRPPLARMYADSLPEMLREIGGGRRTGIIEYAKTLNNLFQEVRRIGAGAKMPIQRNFYMQNNQPILRISIGDRNPIRIDLPLDPASAEAYTGAALQNRYYVGKYVNISDMTKTMSYGEAVLSTLASNQGLSSILDYAARHDIPLQKAFSIWSERMGFAPTMTYAQNVGVQPIINKFGEGSFAFMKMNFGSSVAMIGTAGEEGWTEPGAQWIGHARSDEVQLSRLQDLMRAQPGLEVAGLSPHRAASGILMSQNMATFTNPALGALMEAAGPRAERIWQGDGYGSGGPKMHARHDAYGRPIWAGHLLEEISLSQAERAQVERLEAIKQEQLSMHSDILKAYNASDKSSILLNDLGPRFEQLWKRFTGLKTEKSGIEARLNFARRYDLLRGISGESGALRFSPSFGSQSTFAQLVNQSKAPVRQGMALIGADHLSLLYQNEAALSRLGGAQARLAANLFTGSGEGLMRANMMSEGLERSLAYQDVITFKASSSSQLPDGNILDKWDGKTKIIGAGRHYLGEDPSTGGSNFLNVAKHERIYLESLEDKGNGERIITFRKYHPGGGGIKLVGQARNVVNYSYFDPALIRSYFQEVGYIRDQTSPLAFGKGIDLAVTARQIFKVPEFAFQSMASGIVAMAGQRGRDVEVDLNTIIRKIGAEQIPDDAKSMEYVTAKMLGHAVARGLVTPEEAALVGGVWMKYKEGSLSTEVLGGGREAVFNTRFQYFQNGLQEANVPEQQIQQIRERFISTNISLMPILYAPTQLGSGFASDWSQPKLSHRAVMNLMIRGDGASKQLGFALMNQIKHSIDLPTFGQVESAFRTALGQRIDGLGEAIDIDSLQTNKFLTPKGYVLKLPEEYAKNFGFKSTEFYIPGKQVTSLLSEHYIDDFRHTTETDYSHDYQRAIKNLYEAHREIQRLKSGPGAGVDSQDFQSRNARAVQVLQQSEAALRDISVRMFGRATMGGRSKTSGGIETGTLYAAAYPQIQYGMAVMPFNMVENYHRTMNIFRTQMREGQEGVGALLRGDFAARLYNQFRIRAGTLGQVTEAEVETIGTTVGTLNKVIGEKITAGADIRDIYTAVEQTDVFRALSKERQQRVMTHLGSFFGRRQRFARWAGRQLGWESVGLGGASVEDIIEEQKGELSLAEDIERRRARIGELRESRKEAFKKRDLLILPRKVRLAERRIARLEREAMSSEEIERERQKNIQSNKKERDAFIQKEMVKKGYRLKNVAGGSVLEPRPLYTERALKELKKKNRSVYNRVTEEERARLKELRNQQAANLALARIAYKESLKEKRRQAKVAAKQTAAVENDAFLRSKKTLTEKISSIDAEIMEAEAVLGDFENMARPLLEATFGEEVGAEGIRGRREARLRELGMKAKELELRQATDLVEKVFKGGDDAVEAYRQLQSSRVSGEYFDALIKRAEGSGVAPEVLEEMKKDFDAGKPIAIGQGREPAIDRMSMGFAYIQKATDFELEMTQGKNKHGFTVLMPFAQIVLGQREKGSGAWSEFTLDLTPQYNMGADGDGDRIVQTLILDRRTKELGESYLENPKNAAEMLTHTFKMSLMRNIISEGKAKSEAEANKRDPNRQKLTQQELKERAIMELSAVQRYVGGVSNALTKAKHLIGLSKNWQGSEIALQMFNIIEQSVIRTSQSRGLGGQQDVAEQVRRVISDPDVGQTEFVETLSRLLETEALSKDRELRGPTALFKKLGLQESTELGPGTYRTEEDPTKAVALYTDLFSKDILPKLHTQLVEMKKSAIGKAYDMMWSFHRKLVTDRSADVFEAETFIMALEQGQLTPTEESVRGLLQEAATKRRSFVEKAIESQGAKSLGGALGKMGMFIMGGMALGGAIASLLEGPVKNEPLDLPSSMVHSNMKQIGGEQFDPDNMPMGEPPQIPGGIPKQIMLTGGSPPAYSMDINAEANDPARIQEAIAMAALLPSQRTRVNITDDLRTPITAQRLSDDREFMS